MKRSGTAENASFISKRSTSSMVMPARSRASRAAGIGPVSMIVGSDPTLAHDLIRALGLASILPPSASDPTRTAAAPSTIPDELPG